MTSASRCKPASLFHRFDADSISLKTSASMVLRATQPLAREDRCRTVAKIDSIGFVARSDRWLVETDLRDIKSTLKMNFIDAKSPDMIAKEINLGACAYNLIHHMMGLAAAAAKLGPRRLSFAAAIRCIHAVARAIFASRLPKDEFQDVLNLALTDLRGLTLPIRAGPRGSEPRKVWPRGARHTMSTSRKMAQNWRSWHEPPSEDFPENDARERSAEEAEPRVSPGMTPGTFPKMTELGKVRDRRAEMAHRHKHLTAHKLRTDGGSWQLRQD